MDPTTTALIAGTCLNALVICWLAARGSPGVLKRAVTQVIDSNRAMVIAVEQQEARAETQRIEHVKQVNELLDLLENIDRTRRSANASVSRREKKELQVEPSQESGTERERSIAGARRHFAQAG